MSRSSRSSSSTGWRASRPLRAAPRGECIAAAPPAERDSGFFAVFDGHNGAFSSNFLAERAAECLLATPSWASGDRAPEVLEAALGETCAALELRLEAEPRMARPAPPAKKSVDNSGSTGVMALVCGASVAVGNVGDSAAVLFSYESGGDVAAQMLTEEHKPNLPGESARIAAAGGEVVVATKVMPGGEEKAFHRVRARPGDADDMAVSRAFGDFSYKRNDALPKEEQVVCATPQLLSFERAASGRQMLLLACDGVWDVMSDADAAAFLRDYVEGHARAAGARVLADACDALVRECLRRGSEDNMTALLVSLGEEPWAA